MEPGLPEYKVVALNMTQDIINPSCAVEEITASFARCASWEDRYFHLIELGEALPAFSAEEFGDAVCFRGCQGCVWLWVSVDLSQGKPVLQIKGESESKIARGLVAIICRLFSGQTPQYVVNFDLNGFFSALELDQHVNAGRRNGLSDMEGHIMTLAQALV